MLFVQQRARRVSGRAEVRQFYGRVGGERGLDGGHVEAEARRDQRHLDERDVVDLCGYAVHAVCGRAREDLVFAWDAEGAEEGVDRFVGADAYEEVFGREGFRRVRVRVS